MKGNFIVIEGVDGSGKETQAKLLVEFFQKKGTPVLYVDFPQYEGFFGKLVAAYLRGEYGAVGQTSPFLVSIIYALDRSSIRDKIQTFLDQGGVVVANRYVPSNIAHQAANIANQLKQKEFIDWVTQLEYEELKLPREDIVVYLSLPWEIGMGRSEEKLNGDSHHHYLEGKADIHEESKEHRQKTSEIYQQLQEKFDHWHRIVCTDSTGTQRPIKQIHEEILSLLNV